MNELRMYVEHLFEGKTMTAELIELKEEIYGNLVARYEDYLSQGLEPAEALARTKASMTSVDDVLEDAKGTEGEPAGAAAPTAVLGQGAPASAAPAPAAGRPANPAYEGAAAPGAAGAPGAPRPSRRKWPIVAVAVAVVLALFVLVAVPLAGILLFDVTSDSADRVHVSEDGVSVGRNDDRVTVADDGTVRVDGEVADDLLKAVVSADAPESWGLPLTNKGKIEELARTLPMGAWLTGADVDAAGGTVTLRYERVPDQYDGDSIDAALVYDATAVLACVPDASQVQIDISESDDAADFDRYVFTRDALERRYGQKLDGDAIKDDAWEQLKTDHLYQGGFVEQAVDEAERS